MNSRIVVTIILALFLIFMVMAVVGLVTFLNWIPSEKYAYQSVWQTSYGNAEAMKIIDLTGDGKDDILVQNSTSLRLLGVDGKSFLDRNFSSPLVTTMGDVNGDGFEDIVAYAPARLTVFSKGAEFKSINITGLANPARAAVIRFKSGPQIILGDQGNNLLALSGDGKELWRSKLNYTEAVRGLDDALVGGQYFLAAASYNGAVALYDDQGKVRWNYALSGNLRRLRSYDLNGDGTSEILLGGDYGNLVILNASTGKEIKSNGLGQTIVEIREAELDGNPSSREIVVGGKSGGIWGFRADGTQIWSGSVSYRVSGIISLDIDGDGAEEVIVGDEGGYVYVIQGKTGNKFDLASVNSAITRLDAGKVTAPRQLLVADGALVQLMTLRHESAPVLRFLPLFAGLFISVLIIAVAWFIATNPPKPVVKTAIEDQSVESMQSQRRMLHENIADVERLKQVGEMTPDAYLARLKELRGQLADNEAALKKAGVQISIETFKCPNCGGTLTLGTDKCDYCGQTVIT